MGTAFIDKLCGHVALPAHNIALVAAECANAHGVAARVDLVREGERRGPLFVVLSGWACRYQILPEGSRQITAFLMPGDCCDMHLSLGHIMDHNIATLTPCSIATVARTRFEHIIETRPELTRALWWAQLVDEGILRVDRQHGAPQQRAARCASDVRIVRPREQHRADDGRRA